MRSQIVDPRKQRTRQHVIADLSIHYVERFILESGHTAQRVGSDYGYDLLMSTFDEEGYAEPGFVCFQFKAAESLNENGPDYVYDLDIRDYNLWTQEKLPVILILYDASRRRAYWHSVQQYFNLDSALKPKKGAKSVRIRLPKRQSVSRQAIARMRKLKQAATHQEWRIIP